MIIVASMFLRGARLPGRGELVEQRLPVAPRPQHLAAAPPRSWLCCAVALIVLPFDFREALINTMIGTVMALSLVVITGFVGQISVVQLALAGVSGFIISHLAVERRHRLPARRRCIGVGARPWCSACSRRSRRCVCAA